MKKVLVMLAAGAIVTSAFADLTSFKWADGTLTDKDSVTVEYITASVLTVLDTDATADIAQYIAGDQINIGDLRLFTAIDRQDNSGPPFGPKTLNTGAIDDGTTARVGMFTYAIVANGQFADIASIQVGDYIGITEVGGALIDLAPGGGAALPSQSLNPGAVSMTVEVIPEPATFGLMGIAGLGMFLARKKARR